MPVVFVLWGYNPIITYDPICLALLTKYTELICLAKSASLLEYYFGGLAIIVIILQQYVSHAYNYIFL